MCKTLCDELMLYSFYIPYLLSQFILTQQGKYCHPHPRHIVFATVFPKHPINRLQMVLWES